jgi:hypothetical protein
MFLTFCAIIRCPPFLFFRSFMKKFSFGQAWRIAKYQNYTIQVPSGNVCPCPETLIQ